MSADPPSRRGVFDWLDQVAADPDLPANAFKVAYVISQHVNRRTGLAWPKQQNIADLAALNKRTVREMVHALADAGYVRIGSRQGNAGGNWNTYEPTSPDDGKGEKSRHAKGEEFSTFDPPTKGENSRQQSGKSTSPYREPTKNQESVTPLNRVAMGAAR